MQFMLIVNIPIQIDDDALFTTSLLRVLAAILILVLTMPNDVSAKLFEIASFETQDLESPVGILPGTDSRLEINSERTKSRKTVDGITNIF